MKSSESRAFGALLQRLSVVIVLVVSLTLHPLLLHAADSAAVLKTKSISIFKNGSCFFTKEGTLPLVNNQLRLPVPSAINGTYWLNTPGERTIRSVLFKNELVKVKRDVNSVIELLENNIGKNISFELVRYAPLGTPPNTGGIVGSGTPQNMGLQAYSGKILGVNRTLNTFKIEDKLGTHYFDVASLAGTNYSIVDAQDSKQQDSSVRYAIINPTKSMDELKLQELSLQNGVQWIPSYNIRLNSAKEARIELKATIENFSAEDILNAETEVVVGVPQLYFSRVMDPVTSPYMTQLNTLLPAYNNSQYNQSRDINVRSARSTYKTTEMSAGVSADVANNYNTSFESEAEASNDIFIYKLGAMTLERNTKAFVPVFATNVEYKDIHECDIPDVVNYEYSRVVNNRDDNFDVFHSIEIHNTSGYPLTTGVVVVHDDKNHFLAQDQLKYIAKGGRGQVHLAKALSVTLKNSEEELERTDNVKRINKIPYGKAQLRGTISINNFDDKAITIKIKKHVNGSVSSAPNGNTKKQSQNFGLNPQSEISWEVTVGAGEKKELSYEYETVYRQ